MAQRTFTVAHPEAHEASPAQIAAALRSTLAEDGLTRDGDYTVQGYENHSGVSTKYTVEVKTRKAKAPESDAPEGDKAE